MRPMYAKATLEGQVLIKELKKIGVTSDSQGQSLEMMDYYSLRSLLAIERIKRGDD